MIFKLLLCNVFGNITASGTVFDSTGDPLIGVSVGVKGKPGLGTATDNDGTFSFKMPEGSILVFSYIGCVTRELKATSDMEVTLEDDAASLDEVVVIGYGAVKRKDLTTAGSTVGEEALANRPVISAAQAIQGKAPGVAVRQPTGATGGGMTVRVRGTTSINGSKNPSM